MDDVLAQLMKSLGNYHNRVYKTQLDFESYTDYKLTTIWQCTEKEMFERVFGFYNSSKLDTVLPMPGAYEGLKKLSQNYELIVITSRPDFIAERSSNWLQKKFPKIKLKTYFTNQFSPNNNNKITKATVCQKIGVDLMVEDCYEYAQDCANNGITTLLFERPWNRNCQETNRIIRVWSWPEIVKFVANLKLK